MQSPYFVSVDPSLAKLSMFFGRRREVGAIRNYVLNGDSILLIGERRIGKTFLLYTIADLPTTAGLLKERMLDQQTAEVLVEFNAAMSSVQWLYLDLLAVANPAGFYFQALCGLQGDQVERLTATHPMDHATFVGEMAHVSKDLSSAGRRAVVIVDEVEKLLEWADAGIVLLSLKAIIQQCDAIDFILAGDIKPHQETREFTSLRGAMRSLYLGPLELADAAALIEVPVKPHLSFEGRALERTIELTGGKPGLIQIVCDHICETVSPENASDRLMTREEFDQLWEFDLRDRVFDSFGAPLREFFEGLQGDERAVFAYLAHHPMARESQIASALGLPSASIRSSLRRLQTSYRVYKSNSMYRLSAGIVEEFGRHFIISPVVQAPEETDHEQEDSPLRRQVWASIEAVETELRQLIIQVYSQRNPQGWEEALAKRHPDAYAHWIETRSRSEGAFKRYASSKQAEENILHYCTFGELGDVITQDWDLLFKEVLDFGKRRENKRYWTEMMQTFNQVRNVLAHHRYAPENELLRAEVYCNDIAHTLSSAIRPNKI